MNTNRIVNENFYDEYQYFDSVLAKRFKIEENGVVRYIKEMKNAVIDVRDVLPEWDPTIARLQKMKVRYDSLDNAESSFDDFQGKDEDVVWIKVFLTKLESHADPLSKYSKLEFTYKKRKKSFFQKLKALFS
ncbi:hypothetical protein SAMN02910377_02338 [Pseudobutyrivibrio ruminis]|uniref:Uncharacterized protein n=1 Tax=Pseudobutyrivibrio ruminis TaxID=46206 RepID=A0A1H7LFN3_9FIRM|nr:MULTISPECIES: DUF6548 family protein [Pseudobutyrivibrio]MBE5912807.1 hypothetical protein [Pseudobutyrivibrio ruminis]SEK97660.1 hypothetical protein SAMN02910377_02338 [Pseudobutyrivibrio ruminis]SET43253.1 hypothetical protein SAMN02910413_0143 [Pseudobutyrivibrio sp. C4]